MPVTAVLPDTSPCRICGHPIRWTSRWRFVRVPNSDQAAFAAQQAKTAPPCPGGCGRTVNNADHPCDMCWDRLPADLRRGLLLSLAGIEDNTARTDVATYFRDHAAQEPTDHDELRRA
ncbi:hypothetical protein KC238_23765 [Mycobacteroides chelonae]|uniref:hypothetical protein n=1 Tax=Mycobacteroides chelonae TaxID=1774 RepID=UPI001C2BC7C1|nr:hypothetical protein [Mycobacteroides chelonae]MBV0920278.1 hypothetical protein [Mycobacteroides chelonae]